MILKRLSLFFTHNRPLQSKYYNSQLPTTIPSLLKLLQRESNLNEKAVLLQQLSQLIISQSNTYISRRHMDELSQEIKKWEGGSGRFQRIATVGWVIDRLNLTHKHSSLFGQIMQRIRNDEWYVTLDECIKALESFCRLEDSDEKEQLLSRVQLNIQKTMFEEDMVAYKRVACALLVADQRQSPLWDYMEQQIVQNLSMPYEVETLVEIFRAYALSQNGSHLFYQEVQEALYLGHRTRSVIKSYFAPQLYSGQFYALAIETYFLCDKHIQSLSQFTGYLYERVQDRRVKYRSLAPYTRIIYSLGGLLRSEADAGVAIAKLLQNTSFTAVRIEQLLDFYTVVAEKKITVPQAFSRHIEEEMIKNIECEKYSPFALMQFNEIVMGREDIPNRELYHAAVEKVLINTMKYLEGPETMELVERSREYKMLPVAVKQQFLLLD